MKTRLLSFINKHQILNKHQFGFREYRSTGDVLAKLTELIHQTLETTTPCLVIFIDRAKAFDTLKHEILLNKLEEMGIRGLVKNLMTSYIQNRKQIVRIGEHAKLEKQN